MSLSRESYFWHKVHSLTGIIPVGYYLVQHLTLNTFTLGGPEKYDSVIRFFEGMPKHFLLALKIGGIWIPLIFHAIYGFYIVMRAEPNYSNSAYKFRENRYYMLQRLSGVFAMAFLIFHVSTTSINNMVNGPDKTVFYANWAAKLSANGYILFAFYALGIIACTYHLSYGIWNFCIRWGITISEKAQMKMGKFSLGMFVLLTAMGLLALVGFFWAPFAPSADHAGPAITQPIGEAL